MSEAALTVTPGVDLPNDESITRQDLNDAIEDMTLGDLTRAHGAASSSIPMIGTTAPTAPPALKRGELWVNTLDQDGSSTDKNHVLETFNGTTFRPVNAFYIGATKPTYTASPGMLWYDTTLGLMRQYGSICGIFTWHPIDSAYQVWINASGVTTNIGDTVTRYTASAVLRRFDSKAIDKDVSIIGVAMEAVADGLPCVIAMLASGVTVNVRCDATTAIDQGDGLVRPATADAVTCGPLVSNSNSVTNRARVGVYPFGCFAEALEAKASGIGLVMSRLLGTVGGGVEHYKGAATIAYEGDASTSLANANWDGATWNKIDLTACPNGSVDFIDSIKHKPILGVFLQVHMEVDAGGASEMVVELLFAKDSAGTVRHAVIHAEPETASSGLMQEITGNVYVPTADENDPEIMGNVFWWRGSKSGPNTPNVRKASFTAVGYRF